LKPGATPQDNDNVEETALKARLKRSNPKRISRQIVPHVFAAAPDILPEKFEFGGVLPNIRCT
jgi:hypothetical protein